MSAKPKNAQQARVDVGTDTSSDKALVSRAKVVGTMAPNTTTYTSNAIFKASVDDFVASGVALATADADVAQKEADLTQVRGDRDKARGTCRACHAVCIAQVEKNSPTATELQAYGFTQLEIVKLGGVLPTGILWKVSHKTGQTEIHVKFPGKGRQCVVEISPDPATATSFKRLEGHGVIRVLAGYAPGTYWARAATSLADGRSDWFGPVAITVK
jgi:hypothetical protein